MSAMEAALDDAGKVFKKQRACAERVGACVDQLISLANAARAQASSGAPGPLASLKDQVQKLGIEKDMNNQTKELHAAVGKLNKVRRAALRAAARQRMRRRHAMPADRPLPRSRPPTALRGPGISRRPIPPCPAPRWGAPLRNLPLPRAAPLPPPAAHAHAHVASPSTACSRAAWTCAARCAACSWTARPSTRQAGRRAAPQRGRGRVGRRPACRIPPNPHTIHTYTHACTRAHVPRPQVIAEHFYREGRFELGDSFAREAGVPGGAELKAPYMDMHRVLQRVGGRAGGGWGGGRSGQLRDGAACPCQRPRARGAHAGADRGLQRGGG